MVSDGNNWQFLRLDSKALLISLKFSCIVEAGRRKVYVCNPQRWVGLLIIYRYQFVDVIIQAAVASSPHTTPKTSFPATHQLWRREIEAAVFGTPFSLAAYLRLPDSHYLVSDDEGEGDLEGMGEFKIIHANVFKCEGRGGYSIKSSVTDSNVVQLLPIRIAPPPAPSRPRPPVLLPVKVSRLSSKTSLWIDRRAFW